ncbi:MAG: hypothetical protein AAF551_02655, partial [Bacteroidota bacterium]
LNHRLDSLFEVNLTIYTNLRHLDQVDDSVLNYQVYQDALKASKKLNFHKGILKSYLALLEYYTLYQNLDSLFHYSRLFENYHHLHPDEQLNAKYLRTMGHTMLYDYFLPELALPYFLNALAFHEHHPFDVKFLIKSGIVDCYIYKDEYDLAIEQIMNLLKDSARISVLEKNLVKESLASAYLCNNQIEQSNAILNELITAPTILQDSSLYIGIKLLQACKYYMDNHHQQAIDSLLSLYDLVKQYWSHGLDTYYTYLSLSYAGNGQLQKAVANMRKAMENRPVTTERPKILGSLSEFYERLGKKDSALYYNSRKVEMIDSIRRMEKKMYVKFSQVSVEATEAAAENLTIKKANKQQRYYLIVLSLSSLLIVVGIVAYTRLHRNRKLKEAVKPLIQKEKRVLQRQIKTREDELSATLMKLTSKMQTLSEIKDQFDATPDGDLPERLREPINLLDKLLKNDGSDHALTERLESQHLGLVVLLRELYPKLSKTNIKHCLLVKLGLSIKESADFLNVNTNTVKTARYRAKSKLGLTEEMSLETFLNDLYASHVGTGVGA